MSSSSRASVSPVVLLKLLVLDEEREMFGLLLPLLHSFSFINDLQRKPTTNRELKIWCSKKKKKASKCHRWYREESWWWLQGKSRFGLTSLYWGRSQVSLDWMMSLTSLPGTVDRSLQAFGHCRKEHRKESKETLVTTNVTASCFHAGRLCTTDVQDWCIFANLRVCLSDGLSVLEWRRGKRPERRFTGLFRGDLADNTGGWGSHIK